MIEGLTITRVELTNAAASEILQTAVDAGQTFGFGYWAELMAVKRDKRTSDAPQGALRSIKIKDHDSGEIKTINYGRLRKAVSDILGNPKGCDAVGTAKRMAEYDNPDGPLAEEIIQVAFHGKVIYG